MTLDEIMTANPMIQSTLDLIELIGQRQEEDLQKLEEKVAQQYREFGVDISAYDIREEKSTETENPLIRTLINEQRAKQAKAQELKKEREKREEKRESEQSSEENPAPAGRSSSRGMF